MRGQTCGICGKADGEVRQEYVTPNERVSRNATSFAHSWVLPAKSCREASGKICSDFKNATVIQKTLHNDELKAVCKQYKMKGSNIFPGCFMQLESVKLEKQVRVEGEESKCYSVEPVLRCLTGCQPVRTTSVTVGYHCVPMGEQLTPRTHLLKHSSNLAPILTALLSLSETNMNRSDGLSSIYEKSIDVRETAESHLACRCTPQCA